MALIGDYRVSGGGHVSYRRNTDSVVYAPVLRVTAASGVACGVGCGSRVRGGGHESGTGGIRTGPCGESEGVG